MTYGLFLPRRWARQPQGLVEVDYAHPVLSGVSLKALRLGSLARPLVGTDTSGANRPTKPIYLDADRGYANSNSATRFQTEYRALTTSERAGQGCFFLKFGWDNTATPSGNILLGNADPDFSSYSLTYVHPGGVRAAHTFAGSSANIVEATMDITPGDRLSYACVVKSGESVSIVSPSSIVTTATTLTSSYNANINVMTDSSGSSGTREAAFISGFFTASQIDLNVVKEFLKHPYQILRPVRPIFYSFPSGGITIPTLSLAGVQDITASGARPKVTLTF